MQRRVLRTRFDKTQQMAHLASTPRPCARPNILGYRPLAGGPNQPWGVIQSPIRGLRAGRAQPGSRSACNLRNGCRTGAVAERAVLAKTPGIGLRNAAGARPPRDKHCDVTALLTRGPMRPTRCAQVRMHPRTRQKRWRSFVSRRLNAHGAYRESAARNRPRRESPR